MNKNIINKCILAQLLLITTITNTPISFAQIKNEKSIIDNTEKMKKSNKLYIATTSATVFNKPNGYKLNSLNKGEEVDVLSEVIENNQMYVKIKYGTSEGFVEAKNLSSEKQLSNIKYISTIQSTDCYIYEEPKINSKIVKTLPSGTPIESVKNIGEFTEIVYNNIKGYIETNVLSNEPVYKKMFITDSIVKMYLSPSKESDVVGVTSFGEQVELIRYLDEEYKDFVEIKSNNDSTSFIEKKYISESKPIEQNIKYVDITKGERFNVYEQPNDKSDNIGEVFGGMKLITNGIIGDFTSIIINGQQAYIKTKYLSPTPKSIERFVLNPNTIVLKNTDGELNILGNLNYKDTIQIQQFLPDPINKFVKIKYSHGNRMVDAYIDKSNISKTKPRDEKIGFIDITSCDEVTLYSENSIKSEVLLNIPAGERIFIKSTNQDMMKVDYNGTLGFINTKNISLEQKYIKKHLIVDSLDILDSPKWKTSLVIGTLKKGDTIEVVKNNIGSNKEFSLIRYKGTYGYIQDTKNS